MPDHAVAIRKAVRRLATATVRVRRSVGRTAGAEHIYGNWVEWAAKVRRPTAAERQADDDLHGIRWIATIPSDYLSVSTDDQIELPAPAGARPIVRVESIRAPLSDHQIAVRVLTS